MRYIKYAFITSLIFSLCISCATTEKNTLHTKFEVKNSRGINITCADETVLKKSDIEIWKNWNINCVRINFNKDDITNCYSDSPNTDVWKPYRKNKDKLIQWTNWLNECDIQVIVSLDLLWGDDHYSNALWSNNGNNNLISHRLNMFTAMHDWANDFPNVVYIEAWNEPHPYNDLYKTYFLPTIASKVKSHQFQSKTICMAPADWGNISGLDGWDGLNSKEIIYSTHIYDPWMYTHQKIYGNPSDSAGWPGWHRFYSISEPLVYIDINTVRDYFQKITDFRTRTGSEVIVTEFGVLRWAIDNDKYLNDVIKVFEENKIPWIFHSLSGWNGWNPTFSSIQEQNNQTMGGEETAALKVLKSYWLSNK